MAKLSSVFKELLKCKSEYLSTNKGKEFESRIHSCLRDYGFELLSKKNDTVLKKYLNEIKPLIQNPLGTDIFKNTLKDINPKYTNRYIIEPYGANDFPDILVFTKEYIFVIETKFTKDKTKHPVWNNNLPKANTIYIFGSYGLQDLTIFKGSDILPQNERELLVKFFKEADWVKDFEDEMKIKYNKGELLFERGFFVYPRTNFNQKKNINPKAETDYFKAKSRNRFEQNVVAFLIDIEEKSEE